MINLPSSINVKSKVDLNYFLELVILSIGLVDFYPTQRSLICGGVILFLAISLKLWLASYPKRKNKNFEIYGPYRFLRFPFYLGTFLLGLGISVSARSPTCLILHMGLFALLYFYKTKGLDQERLEQTGISYAYYKSHISALIPCIYPYPHGSSKSPSLRNLLDFRSKPDVGVVGMVGIFFFYAYSFQKWTVVGESSPLIPSILCALLIYLAVSKLKIKRYSHESTPL